MNTTITSKILPVVLKFVNTKAIMALRNGILYTMPLTIVGSIFLLLANFPYQPFVDFLDSLGIIGTLNQVTGATFDIIALVAVVGIAYEYVKGEGYPSMNAGIIALVSFLITQESFITNADNVTIGGVINKQWTGGKGMIAAILIGLITGYIYAKLLDKNVNIKMPEGVPEGIANSFTALTPALIIITMFTTLYGIFKIGFDTTMIEAIYVIIQTPLQGMTDSLGGVIMMGILIPFLWFFGVHGSTIVGGIMGPILQANSLENQAILNSGLELTVENGGHIVTQQFLDQFMTVTGSGMTIGVVLFMLLFAKSAQNKELGKLSLIPGLFNINEPVLFGTPIVLNPLLAIPFILMPVISGIILYVSISIGLVPLFAGVMVPWTTPPIISGFLVGGLRMAILQTLILILSFFVYYPFIRKIDKINLDLEQQSKQD